MRIPWIGLRKVVLALSAVTAHEGLTAQVVTVGDRVTCTSCVIRLDPQLTYDSRATEGGRGGVPLQVIRWVGSQQILRLSGRLPLVLTEQGRIGPEIGTKGAGPGEFQTVGDLVRLPGDSLLILDSELSRVSIFGPKLTFLRSIALPFPASAIAVLEWPRIVAVNGMSYSPDQVGWPLHIMDFSASPATRQASFGDNDAQLQAGRDYALMRKIMGILPNSFWAYHITRYQLTRYSRDGKTELSIRRQPTWFSKDSPWSIGGPNTAPPPMLQAAAVRGDTLWVAIGVPRTDWQRAWRREDLRNLRELTAQQRPSQFELYMSRIEVIDLKSSSLIAQKDIDGVVVEIDDQLRVAIYDQTRNLEPRLQLFTLGLSR